MRDYNPDDHIHRFPSQLHSHTSYHPYSSATHEPTVNEVDLPEGMQLAAMNIAPYEMVNMSPMQQRWARYHWER